MRRWEPWAHAVALAVVVGPLGPTGPAGAADPAATTSSNIGSALLPAVSLTRRP
jgi:hypothetical protein